MTPERQREKAIRSVTELLWIYHFKLEYKVKKKPQGIKVIIEVTQESMDFMLQHAGKDLNEQHS